MALQAGNISDAEMRRTFNLGIGMILILEKEAAQKLLDSSSKEEPVFEIGEVVQGEGVTYSR
jgi:phosphoribosylformylglycinamidine cyclo-ligase